MSFSNQPKILSPNFQRDHVKEGCVRLLDFFVERNRNSDSEHYSTDWKHLKKIKSQQSIPLFFLVVGKERINKTDAKEFHSLRRQKGYLNTENVSALP